MWFWRVFRLIPSCAWCRPAIPKRRAPSRAGSWAGSRPRNFANRRGLQDQASRGDLGSGASPRIEASTSAKLGSRSVAEGEENWEEVKGYQALGTCVIGPAWTRLDYSGILVKFRKTLSKNTVYVRR